MESGRRGAGDWSSSQQVDREKLEGKEGGGKTEFLQRRTTERQQSMNNALRILHSGVPSREGMSPFHHLTPIDDCCPIRWQDTDNTFLICSDFQSSSLGHPSPQHLIKGRKVIKEGHVTFPVTLNLITPPPLPHLQSINMTCETTRCNTKLFIAC